jgi:rhodanese-related sulfurtransferase
MAAPDSAYALAAARAAAFVVDLRDADEKHEGICERAHAIPWSTWGADGTDGGKVPPPGTLPSDKSTLLITHCRGGGRGGKAKDSLQALGYTNVLNGGGPQKPELWAAWAGPLQPTPGQQ